MTKRQKECFDFILKYNEHFGFSPSYEEIKNALKLKSKSGVARLVNGLADRKRITRLSGAARSIQILYCPCCGR